MHFRVSATPPTPTVGFEAYWAFASERQSVYLRKLEGCTGALTSDPVIARNRFTNAYRAADRVSQFLISEVQYDNDWSWPDTFARTLVFKIFNRIDTWEHIRAQIGELTLLDLMNGRVDNAIAQIAGRRPVYSAAYVMPPPRSFEGPKYKRHLDLLRRMVQDRVHIEIAQSRSMAEAFSLLHRYESIGPFLAYQFTTDLNYSSHLDFAEDEFVVAGPGALRGLRKCFSDPGDLLPSDLIKWMSERQHSAFSQRGLTWTGLWGRDLQLIDIQNLFCEVDKYTREALPELSCHAAGKRIKQRYRATTAPMTAWFPPKWGLNARVPLRVSSVSETQLSLSWGSSADESERALV